jgi:hypothetical protein
MIYFDGNIHVYYNTAGVVYDSPSKVFAKYKNKFDAKAVATRYARTHGETPAHWMAEWDKERDKSLVRGTGIHQTKEDLMFGRGIDKFRGQQMQVQNADLILSGGAITDLIDLPDGIYPEIPIWNHNWKISGKPDKLIIETIHSHGKPTRWAHIDDFKTNKSIDKTSYEYPDGSYKMMLGPLYELMDCNWVHYGLQMSFYQYIMETAGFKVGERTLIHVPHPIVETGFTGEEIRIQPNDVIYKMPYMRREINLTLSDYSTGRRLQTYADILKKQRHEQRTKH